MIEHHVHCTVRRAAPAPHRAPRSHCVVTSSSTASRSARRYRSISACIAASSAASPSNRTTSTSASGASSMQVCSTPQGSSPAPTRPDSGASSGERQGTIERAVPAEEFGAIPGQRGLLSAQIHEGDAFAEFRAPPILCEQRAGGRMSACHHERRRLGAVRAERPLHIRRDRQPPGQARTVAKFQARYFDRIGHRHVLQQLRFDTVCRVLEAAVALPMPRDVPTSRARAPVMP